MEVTVVVYCAVCYKEVTGSKKCDNETHQGICYHIHIPSLLSEPSLLTVTTSTRHVNIREAADKEYLKNVERMKTQCAKRKRHQCNTYCAGDSVTVQVPKHERSSTDMPRLLCYVYEVRHDLYQLL